VQAYRTERANVPQDPNATLDPEQDPAADTQPETSQDGQQDTPQATVDWETRYKQLQALKDRQLAEANRKLAELQSAPDEDDDEGTDEQEEPAPNAGAERLERDSWRLAEKEYGRSAINAYGKAARLLDRASTPSDYVAAFEAYYTARLDSETKEYAKQAKAAPEDAQPPTESNRPDVSPRNDLNQEAEAAFAKGDSRGFLLAQIRKIRGE
jgi:hypothetical protein